MLKVAAILDRGFTLLGVLNKIISLASVIMRKCTKYYSNIEDHSGSQDPLARKKFRLKNTNSCSRFLSQL